ncbi:MAG: hypothetical protein ACLGIR_11230 [Actinomycetes bacterium]
MSRLRRPAVLLTAALAASALAAHEAPEAPACTDTAGREVLGVDGLDLTFDAPMATAPELAATSEVTGPGVSRFRSATFQFVVDAAPSDEATLDLSLEWGGPSDFDIFVFDDEFGAELGRAAEENIPAQDTDENVTVSVADCATITVFVKSWAGNPAETLSLSIDVTPGETVYAAPRGLEQTILYAGGDRPGQVAMLHDFAGDPTLPQGRLVEERPTLGQPNSYTRPVVGFDNPKNPFLPFFTYAAPSFEEPLVLDGEVSALVWASSSTMSQDGGAGELRIHLYADGVDLGPAVIDGSDLGDEPRPFLVSFGEVDGLEVFDLTLQVGADPAASSNGPGNPANASHTVWYDSVQFPTRVVVTG